MRSFGNYVLSSRVHAIGVVSLIAIFSFYLSSILIAMMVMRRGGKFGLQVILGCVILDVLAISMIHQLELQDVLIITLRTWLPVWCCAMVLRITQSQAAMVMLAGFFGTVFIILMYYLVDDVPLWWQTWFNDLLNSVVSGDLAGDALDRIEQLKSDIALIAPLINPFIVSFLVIRLITVILAGRWWQSMLFNPGGFRQEFYALHLPRPLLYLTLIGIIVMLLDTNSQLLPVRDILWLVIVMYLFQGISCVHRLVRKKEFSTAWLVVMYSFLVVLFPHMIVLVACIGMADSWMKRKSTANG